MTIQPPSRIFEFFDASTKGVEAKIEIGKLSSGRALFFKCQRLNPHINKTIYPVFLKAISNQAQQDMCATEICMHKKTVGALGNSRGSLSECSCNALDRIQCPETRLSYENKVLHSIFEILKMQSQKNFHLKLAIVHSGRLLGEEIILFRLLHELKQKRYEGVIQIHFIDYCYSSLLQEYSLDEDFKEAVGNNASIEQFLIEMSQCLPTNITLKGNFFESANYYVKQVVDNHLINHNLLISVDTGSSNEVIGFIKGSLGRGQANPIILDNELKLDDCSFKPNQDMNCYQPKGGGEYSVRKASKPDNTLLSLGAASLMAALIGLAILNSKE